MKRSALREKTAGIVNALSRKELLEGFAISRVADLTGLDRIGVPVVRWSRVAKVGRTRRGRDRPWQRNKA